MPPAIIGDLVIIGSAIGDNGGRVLPLQVARDGLRILAAQQAASSGAKK